MDYVEHEIKEESSKSITPLYATQTEGMMDVGIIFDVKHPMASLLSSLSKL